MIPMSFLVLQDSAQTAEPNGLGPVQWVIIFVVAVIVICLPLFCCLALKKCKKEKQKFWNQLLAWKKWKEDIQQWIKDRDEWITNHCNCGIPDPTGPPPPPPTWPNGDPE
jgi:hypothetical protein